MESNLIFIGLIIIVVVLMLGYSWWKVGSFERMKTIFKKNKALADWKPFIGIALGLLLAITFVWNGAKADDQIDWVTFTEVGLGMDYVYNGSRSAACVSDGNQFNDRLTGNARITQNVFEWYQVQMNVEYQHHSCALNGDDLTFDGGGIRVVRRWEW